MFLKMRPPRPQALSRKGANGPRRPAFSLVELLVAMALIVFIMSILSAAFAAAAGTFRDLKASGDLAERLRGAVMLLRSDLGSPHFDGRRKLSDGSFWRTGPGPNDFGPPAEGFFRLYQDVPAGYAPNLVQAPNVRFDGLPPDQVTEFRNVRSALHFAVRLPGKGPGELFSTVLNNANNTNPLVTGTTYGGQEGREQRFQDGINPVFRSQWADVAWWLTPAVDALGNQEFTKVDGVQTAVVAQPLYVLRRRQQLLWSGSGTGTLGNIDVTPADVNDEVSIRPGTQQGAVRVNKSADITMPAFRWNMQRASANPDPATDPAFAGWPVAFGGQVPNLTPPAPPPNMYPAEPLAGGPATGGRVEDVVLNNVLSMDVRLLLHGATDFVDLFDPSVQRFGVRAGQAARNPAYRFSTTTLPQGPLVFDTWSRANSDGHDYETNWDAAQGNLATIPMYQDTDPNSQAPLQRIRIRAILITIRIWDQKTQKTRQVTLIQDL